jgi:ribose transport system ATP-binding protein
LAVLAVQGIHKRFGTTQALRDVTLTFPSGTVTALMGENGSGKSTLLRILAGETHADQGNITRGDQTIQLRSPLDARADGIALIHQELALCPHLSALENMLLGFEPARFGIIDRKVAESLCCRALQQIGLDPSVLPVQTSDLPISVRQRLEIARALIPRTSDSGSRVLLFDEPTSSLSETDADHLFRVVRNLAKDGHTVLYVTNYLNELDHVADRVVVLRDGELAEQWDSLPKSFDPMIQAMVGRSVESLYPPSASMPGEVILKVDTLATRQKLKSASFEVRRGEVLGIAGLTGSGRTELFRALFGLDSVVNKKVSLAGNRLENTPRDCWSKGCGMLSEDRAQEGLSLKQSISENIHLPSYRRGLIPKTVESRSQFWIDSLSIRAQGANQRVRDLSGGNQQKVALARLLHADVDVLLLDEPTRGIDIGSKALIYERIRTVTSQGKAVVLVSSYLPELMGLSDRIAVMTQGTLGVARPVAEWSPESITREASSG